MLIMIITSSLVSGYLRVTALFRWFYDTNNSGNKLLLVVQELQFV
jgi:hypothetical protein